MTEFTLYLIQRSDSPYHDVLQSALATSGMNVVMGRAGGALPAELSTVRAMVVLDTSAMDRKQRDNLAESLAAVDAGVLLIAPEADHFFEPAINALQLVGVLAGPATPPQMRAVLEVSRENHLRLAGLKNQRDNAQRKLEERLIIEQAVDALMAELGMKESQAMRCLQQNARRKNQSVAQVASAYLENPESLRGKCL